MIKSEIRQEIMRRLAATEREHGVKVLLAVESGSRAWGFASPNSDYDVRFVYARPREWYLSIDLEKKRDVIGYGITDDIDLNGWDVRKALRLFRSSNPAFVEWINSPITYMENGGFAPTCRNLLSSVYSSERGIYHYRSMAKTNYRGYLRSDLVPLKKYFYVLRPLLAVRWLEQYGQAAPIEFGKLLPLLDDAEIRADIHSLLERKKVAKEKELGPPIGSLNRFIESELEHLEGFTSNAQSGTAGVEVLNNLFRSVIEEVADGFFAESSPRNEAGKQEGLIR